jgi:hypothetical protein
MRKYIELTFSSMSRLLYGLMGEGIQGKEAENGKLKK